MSADGTAPVGPPALPARLANMLARAQAAAEAATGPERRPAWRLMRDLLGAALAVGYPAQQLADCLGVTAGSIRNRARGDGWLAAAKIQDLAEVDTDTIERWRTDGLLPYERTEAAGERLYAAVDVIRALDTIS